MTDSHRQRLPQGHGTVDLLFLSLHASLHTWEIAHRRSDDKNRQLLLHFRIPGYQNPWTESQGP